MKNLNFVAAGALALVATYPVAATADPMNPSFYAGVFGGGVFYNGDYGNVGYPPSVTTSGTLGTAGGLVGARFQQGDWFFGGELDGGFSFGESVDSSHVGCAAAGLDWCGQKGSIHSRAVVGRSVNGIDIFASAGLAAAFMEYQNTSASASPLTIFGYSVGAGVEFDVTERASARVEFLHDQFGTQATESGYNGKWSQNTVRAAAIFRFGN